MKKVGIFCFVIVASLLFSCKGEDEKSASLINPEDDAAVQEMLDMEREKKQTLSESDLRVIEAFKTDKTTVTALDIDSKDTSFTARLKKLYVNDKNERLAAVFGLKRPGQMGLVIVQKEGGEAVTIPQTGEGESSYTFSKGQNSLVDNGEQITVKINGKTEKYRLIK